MCLTRKRHQHVQESLHVHVDRHRRVAVASGGEDPGHVHDRVFAPGLDDELLDRVPIADIGSNKLHFARPRR
ncbi:MAG: hypothetical protein EA426_05315 [Spirochaetaceae bacterium]|nr:MAG: hypothetical protein EA426_05315 [Spirochaetaceae bacterium]